MSTAAPAHRDTSHTSAAHPRSALRGGSSLLNLRRKNPHQDDSGSASASGSGPSATVSEPPPSPRIAYFDKYPKRREQDKDVETEPRQSPKHVTIEFPTMPERKTPSSSRHGGGLRDWRVVQAHLEPRVAPRNPRRKEKDKEKEREKEKERIRDPDDMVIVSLAGSPVSGSPSPSLSPSPRSPLQTPTSEPVNQSTPEEHTPTASTSGPSTPSVAWPSRDDHSRRRQAKTPNHSHSAPPSSAPSLFNSTDASTPTTSFASTSAPRAVPSSPSLASGFRSSWISSAGTLTSSSATDTSALTPPRTPTSPHEPVVIHSSSVEAMDALIEGMGSGLGPVGSTDSLSFLSPTFGRASRFGYPLYQPPLPTPPEGIKLGIIGAQQEPWRSRRDTWRSKTHDKSRDVSAERAEEEWSRAREQYDQEQENFDDTETETDASPYPSRRTPKTSTSTFGTTGSAVGHGKSVLARDSSSSLSAPSRTGTPANSTMSGGAPPIRIRSDEEIEAEERADVTSPLVPPVRVRQRSGLSVRSGASVRAVGVSPRTVGSSVSGRTLSTSSSASSKFLHQSGSGLARSPGMWDLSNSNSGSSVDLGESDSMERVRGRGRAQEKSRSVVPSIDDIIKMHSPAVVAANQAASKRGGTGLNKGGSPTPSVSTATGSANVSLEPSPAGSSLSLGGTTTPKTTTPAHSRSVSIELEGDEAFRSSMDSIADEAQRAVQALQEQTVSALRKTPRRPSTASSIGMGIPRLQHAKSFPKARASSVQGDSSSLSPYLRSPLSDGASICSGNSGNTVVLPPTLNRAATTTGATGDNALEMAQYLRSPRLTRLLTLRRPANAGLTVSLADVGSLTGHPVIVYLGLGCVRYLVALYDEMAEALNLRLICVDRWGLGRTTDVPTERRGLLEWAGVVEEVADTLGLGRYSVLAHSAGAPYALASSLKTGDRVFGSVHLLAPWVSMAVDGGYKWLKYVPNGLIKTAQAAEWRLQGWMLGKPPTIQYEGIGFDANAPMSQEGVVPPGRPSFSSFSEYDELDDFEGRFASRSTLVHGSGSGEHEGEREKERKVEGKMGTPGKAKASSVHGGADASVSEHGERPRSRKGSKSIFGGLFNNTLPKSSPKRGTSTPPSAFVSGKASSSLSVNTGAANSTSLGGIGTSSIPPVPPLPPIPPIPTSPTTPTPGSRQPKLKTLRSMSSLKAPSTRSEPAMDKNAHKERNVGLGLGMDAGIEGDDSTARTQAWASDFTESDVKDLAQRQRQRRSLSLSARPSTAGGTSTPTQSGSTLSPVPAAGTLPPSPRSPKIVTLASALLQASHAESLKGGTADLLSILERDSKPWGFSYADVRQPVRVWYGDRDDKIGVGSVRWMERVMKSCEVKIVKGAGHSLMTNAEVVVEVLESIAREWDELP